jgi:hypothetical protein
MIKYFFFAEHKSRCLLISSNRILKINELKNKYKLEMQNEKQLIHPLWDRIKVRSRLEGFVSSDQPKGIFEVNIQK